MSQCSCQVEGWCGGVEGCRGGLGKVGYGVEGRVVGEEVMVDWG